jgi:SAM-dependent methyltransferase
MDEDLEDEDIFEANEQFWDASTPGKMEVESYPLDEFRAGESTLFDHEHEELGDVSGKSVLHLQCNNGLETLSLAREGADAVGVDISAESLRYARELAEEAGLDAEFVRCNVYDVPETVDREFDVVYTSRGVLVWLPDLEAWADVIADSLADDGIFYLFEGHPLVHVFDDDLRVTRSYFDNRPSRQAAADFGADEEHYLTRHTLGDVVTALASAGLRIEFVHEFPFDYWYRWEGMVEDANGRYTLPDEEIPLSFSIRATPA